jgi:hypothetical protein
MRFQSLCFVNVPLLLLPKHMKKYILYCLTALSLVSASKAVTISVTVAPGVMTNFPTLVAAPVKVTQVVITSAGTNIAQGQLIDTPTNQFFYTNAAYSNILTYATNYVSTWTNYYGATNVVTNTSSLVDVTNSVAGTTNTYPVRIVLSTPTNTSTRIDNVSYYFQNGIWATNTGTGSATFTITYQQ